MKEIIPVSGQQMFHVFPNTEICLLCANVYDHRKYCLGFETPVPEDRDLIEQVFLMHKKANNDPLKILSKLEIEDPGWN